MDRVISLEKDVQGLRQYYRSGKTKEASWRKSQLKGLLRFLVEEEEAIFNALHKDLGKHRNEAYRDEIGTLVKSVNLALDCLKEWMSSIKAKLPRVAYPSTAELVPEPLGVVLIISSWNFPFGLSLEPLIGAIAAGNAAVVKPSELSPTCSSLLSKSLPNYLDKKAIKFVQGGASVGEQLLQQKWDKIFFTGSTRVGRIVLYAAAKHLTPVTLELGGKCAAIYDPINGSWDRQAAMERILGAKYGACGGQACIAIDYLLVEKRNVSRLEELLKITMKKMFGEDPKKINSIARIVNKEHFLRLKNLLDDPMVKASIVHGGSLDEDNLFIEPTILVDPPLNSAIMTEEIFGPLLPIITLKKIEDSIEFINSRPKALALYVFSKNERFKKSILSETSSGSITFNDAVIQYAADTLPFGGVGESGFGQYHGKFTFDMFSHKKAVLKRGFLVDFWFRFPPWNDHKLQLFKAAYSFDYLSVLLIVLGLKKYEMNIFRAIIVFTAVLLILQFFKPAILI